MSIIPSFRRNSSFFDLWDPFKDFSFPSTRIDWKETPEAQVFKADLPGLKKEEVKVEIQDDRVLQISGERKMEKEDRVERSSGKFSRRFRLPENAKVHEIKAALLFSYVCKQSIIYISKTRKFLKQIKKMSIMSDDSNFLYVKRITYDGKNNSLAMLDPRDFADGEALHAAALQICVLAFPKNRIGAGKVVSTVSKIRYAN